MSRLGRRRVPLEVPISMAVGIALPDPRLLRDPRAGTERAGFVRAALDRLEDGTKHRGAAEGFVAEMVAMLPVDDLTRDGLCRIGGFWAAAGLAVADEERSRGWTREGKVDALVQSALDWDLQSAATDGVEDWVEATMATYMLHAGYYLARTGPEGQAALRAGMQQLAKAVADDRAQVAHPEPLSDPPTLPATREDPKWATALEEARDRRILECLYDERDLERAFTSWCASQNLPKVVVTGPFRDKTDPDRMLFVVDLDLSRTNFRLNTIGLDEVTEPVGTVKCWPASNLPDDRIPDSLFSRVATAGYLEHDPAIRLAHRWLEIALDPEFSDVLGPPRQPSSEVAIYDDQALARSRADKEVEAGLRADRTRRSSS